MMNDWIHCHYGLKRVQDGPNNSNCLNCISIIWKTNAKRFYLRKLLRIRGVVRVIFFLGDFKIIFISLDILYRCVSLDKNGNAEFLEMPQ